MLPVLSRELNSDGLCRRAVDSPRHHGFKVRGSRWRKGLSSELNPSTGVVYAVEPISSPLHFRLDLPCECRLHILGSINAHYSPFYRRLHQGAG
jgi:hypothetical protein